MDTTVSKAISNAINAYKERTEIELQQLIAHFNIAENDIQKRVRCEENILENNKEEYYVDGKLALIIIRMLDLQSCKISSIIQRIYLSEEVQ